MLPYSCSPVLSKTVQPRWVRVGANFSSTRAKPTWSYGTLVLATHTHFASTQTLQTSKEAAPADEGAVVLVVAGRTFHRHHFASAVFLGSTVWCGCPYSSHSNIRAAHSRSSHW